MVKRELYMGYINKCTEIIESENGVLAEQLVDSIVSVFERDIPHIKNGLLSFRINMKNSFAVHLRNLAIVKFKLELKVLEFASPTADESKGDIVLDNKKVFIVHGHDSGMKNTVARYLSKIDLKPIILHEVASKGKTIIEKLEQHTSVGYAIILYTACDLGNSKDKSDTLNPRARQNVIFEHGYLIGKLGRERVVALVEKGVEIPSDNDGVVYITIDSAEAWKYEIAREMKAIGYNIDVNKIL
ncbi:MAG: nucleotide-binding protein [Clostridia bacterium]|nr:nucleotide-binding protein [Clostridia bacterium]